MRRQRSHQIALARCMRAQGWLNREIAIALGICVATASLWTQGRFPYGTPPPSKRKLQLKPVMARLYREGKSIPEIAAVTRVPATTLYEWRRELRLPRNRRSVYVTQEMRDRTHRQFARDTDGSLRREAARLYA